MKLRFYLLIIVINALLFAGCNLGETTGTGTTVPHIYHIGEIDTPGFVYSVAAADNKVYAADGIGGLRIIDITSPAFPQEIDYYEDEGKYYDIKYGGGDYVYIAAGEAGFKIIDVNSPFGPELVGQLASHDNSFGLDHAGNYVYLADNTGGVRILDISSHFNVFEISRIHVGGQNVNNVTVKWPYLFAACRYGLSIVNIENAHNPSEIITVDMNNVNDIKLVDHFAYVAYEGGLRIYDVSVPSDPVELSLYNLPASARSVEVRGEFAYITIGRNGLSILRIANPYQPVEVAYHNPLSGEMSHIFLHGRYMLAANGEGGMLVMEFRFGY